MYHSIFSKLGKILLHPLWRDPQILSNWYPGLGRNDEESSTVSRSDVGDGPSPPPRRAGTGMNQWMSNLADIQTDTWNKDCFFLMNYFLNLLLTLLYLHSQQSHKNPQTRPSKNTKTLMRTSIRFAMSSASSHRGRLQPLLSPSNTHIMQRIASLRFGGLGKGRCASFLSCGITRDGAVWAM